MSTNAKQVYHPFVSPFVQDENNNCYSAAGPTNNFDETMTHNSMGLKAASHVSMDGSPHAHEYQPTCSCHDCQALLHNYTQYDIMEAFVSEHLQYEANIQRTYGFVPCIGGAQGNVAMRLESVDPHTGEETRVPETSTALMFHFHCHQMKEVPADIRQKSHNRFYEHRNNSNINSAAAPSTSSATTAPTRNNNNNYYNNAAALRVPHPHSRAPAASHSGASNNVVAPPPRYNNNTVSKAHHNNRHSNNVAESQQQQYSAPVAPIRHHQQADNAPYANPHNNSNFYYYTPTDMRMTKHSVAFTDAACLGC